LATYGNKTCTITSATLVLDTTLIAIPQSTKPAMASVLVGPIENPSNGHLYYAVSRNTWTGSESEAQSLGGHLVTIKDEDEINNSKKNSLVSTIANLTNPVVP
jgi:hypothetical protein